MRKNSDRNSYVIGFCLSLLLTLSAYFTVSNQILNGGFLVAAVLGLAVLQLIVQLSFFLHLWQEAKPRWNLLLVLTTLGIIFIILAGSVWIMNNLNNRHNLQQDIENFLEKEGVPR